MIIDALSVDGYVRNGTLVLPQYGTFLDPRANKLGYSVNHFEKPHLIFSEELGDLEETVILSGETTPMITELVEKKWFSPSTYKGQDQITDLFKFVSRTSFSGNSYVIRKSDVHQMFEAYVLRGISGDEESRTLAQGFLASDWIPENSVAVIDILKPTSDVMLYKQMLYQAIEHELRKTHKMVRLCNSMDLSVEGEFFVKYGYRLIRRNAEGYIDIPQARQNAGRIELAKILHPKFDTTLLDN